MTARSCSGSQSCRPHARVPCCKGASQAHVRVASACDMHRQTYDEHHAGRSPGAQDAAAHVELREGRKLIPVLRVAEVAGAPLLRVKGVVAVVHDLSLPRRLHRRLAIGQLPRACSPCHALSQIYILQEPQSCLASNLPSAYDTHKAAGVCMQKSMEKNEQQQIG